jgi:uncharacterized protein (DUF305 family)
MYPKRACSLLFLMAAALLPLAGCDLGNNPESKVQNPESPTPYVYNITGDLQYIALMVPHHQLAVDMAELVEEKAQHGELKGLARDIHLSQKDEINRMLIWKGQLSASTTPQPWHISGQGTQAPHDGGHGEAATMPGMDVNLDALAASPNFDRDFILAMIPHHQSAIEMSRAALPNLKKREVRDLAQDIITVQQVEIERMEGWLGEWFGESRP